MIKHFLTLLCFFTLFFIPTSFAEKPLNEEVQKEAIYVGGPDFWRQIRAGDIGYTTNQSVENGNLINIKGKYWEHLRNRWVSPFGILVLIGSFLTIVFFYLFFGRIKLQKPRTGKKIKRWSALDRTIHWITALSFLILGFSGVFIFYGRYFIKPVVPDAFWGSFIYAAKISHNYIGPLFTISLSIMLIKWFKNNIFNTVDLNWLKQGGGMISHDKHPDAGFCNAGEKIWFWLIAIVGGLVSITGLVMDFPLFGQNRLDMQIANIIHGIASLSLFAAAFGHIYIGTLGTEGAFEGMATGKVDESWAEQHHRLWVEKIKNEKTNDEK